MRILLVTALYHPWLGGLEILAGQLACELSSRGHTVGVLTAVNDLETPLGLDIVDGVSVLRIDAYNAHGPPGPRDLLLRRRAVRDLVADLRPSVVHSHDAGAVLVTYESVVPHGPPMVVTVHNVMSLLQPRDTGRLSTVLARAQAVTGVSEDVVADIEIFAPDLPHPPLLVRNGVVPPTTPWTAVPDGPADLLCIGRLVPQKGFDRVLDALVEVVQQEPTTRLLVAGTGPACRDLLHQAEVLGLREAVTMLGRVEHGDVPGLLETSVSLVMPSRFEGLPLVALEAAWAGRPIVGTEVPGLRRAVQDNVTGRLVPPDDTVALSAALLEVVRDRERARRWGAAARRVAQECYGLSPCVDAYEAVYRTVTDVP